MSEARPVNDRRAHYSYTHYADEAVAEGFDALRFSGPIGEWLARTQEEVLTTFLTPGPGVSILDVGTGTGRAAIGLARHGAVVTAVDASNEMLAVGRRRAAEAGVSVTFDCGDAHALTFPDRSFDAAVSLRVLMHTPGWEDCLRELCRVSRARVVVDYPSARSAAAIQAAGRRLAASLGRPVESYRVFSPSRIEATLAREGFVVTAVHRQFVLPIALHKAMGSLRFTQSIETTMERIGLNRLLGSPITIVAQRCAS